MVWEGGSWSGGGGWSGVGEVNDSGDDLGIFSLRAGGGRVKGKWGMRGGKERGAFNID